MAEAPHERAESSPFVPGRTEFLIGQAIEASKLFWMRMNIFMLIQAAWLTGAFTWVTRTPRPSPVVAAMLAALGIALCVIWMSVIRISDWYHAIAVRDAQAAAIKENKTGDYYGFLMLKKCIPADQRPVAPKSLPFIGRPHVPRAVYSIYAAMWVFIAGWVVLVVAAVLAKQTSAPFPP